MAIPVPPLPEEDPWVPNEEEVSGLRPDIAALYRQPRFWQSIRTRFYTTQGENLNRFNFRVTTEITPSMLDEMADVVFYQMQNYFYLDLGFGYIVRSTETGDVRFVYVSYNNRLLDEPSLIERKAALDATMRRDVHGRDILEWANKQLSRSDEVVLKFTNVMFYADKFSDDPLE